MNLYPTAIRSCSGTAAHRFCASADFWMSTFKSSIDGLSLVTKGFCEWGEIVVWVGAESMMRTTGAVG